MAVSVLSAATLNGSAPALMAILPKIGATPRNTGVSIAITTPRTGTGGRRAVIYRPSWLRVGTFKLYHAAPQNTLKTGSPLIVKVFDNAFKEA
jgi:hypothetical protein